MTTQREKLSERQYAVLDAVSRRIPYKAIAAEHDVSETRIQQIVRELKKHFGVTTLPALIEAFESLPKPDRAGDYGFPKYAKEQVPPPAESGQRLLRDDPGLVRFADIGNMQFPVESELKPEPRIVPEGLDGKFSGRLRLLVIVALAIGIGILTLVTVSSVSALDQIISG